MAAIALFAFVGFVAAPSHAKKRDAEADAKIQALTVELKKVEVEDKRNVATSELGKAEALRDKARSIVGKRKQRETLKQTLEELEATIALAAAKIVEAQRQNELAAAKQKLEATRGELAKARQEIEQIEQQQAQGGPRGSRQ